MSNGIEQLSGSTYSVIVCDDASASGSVLRKLSNASQKLEVEIPIHLIAKIEIEDVEALPCFPFKKGIYVFQQKDTGSVLYVGSGGFKAQDLEKRVKQHFNQKDGGGNFRKNWAKCHCKCKDNCDGKSDDCFRRYKEVVNNSILFLFSVCNKENAELLEHALGSCLCSKYSSH